MSNRGRSIRQRDVVDLRGSHRSRPYLFILAAALSLDSSKSSQTAAFPNSAIQRQVQQIMRNAEHDIPKKIPQFPGHPAKRGSVFSREPFRITPIDELPTTPIVKIVRINVSGFFRRFNAGARDHSRYLALMREEQPKIVDAWQKAPKSKRRFIIGSRQDSELAKAYSDALRRQGYEPFFYLDCKPQCKEEHIGAMMASADKAVLIDTISSRNSRYVEVEVAAARSYLGYQSSKPVVVPAVEILESIRTMGERHAAEAINSLSCEDSRNGMRILCAYGN